jgi:hypothetical protein
MLRKHIRLLHFPMLFVSSFSPRWCFSSVLPNPILLYSPPPAQLVLPPLIPPACYSTLLITSCSNFLYFSSLSHSSDVHFLPPTAHFTCLLTAVTTVVMTQLEQLPQLWQPSQTATHSCHATVVTAGAAVTGATGYTAAQLLQLTSV